MFFLEFVMLECCYSVVVLKCHILFSLLFKFFENTNKLVETVKKNNKKNNKVKSTANLLLTNNVVCSSQSLFYRTIF